MARVAVLDALARRFVAFPETGVERTGPHVANDGQIGLELGAFLQEGVEIGVGHSALADDSMQCQARSPKPCPLLVLAFDRSSVLHLRFTAA